MPGAEKAAAFLETRRYAAYQGATTECVVLCLGALRGRCWLPTAASLAQCIVHTLALSSDSMLLVHRPAPPCVPLAGSASGRASPIAPPVACCSRP